MEHPRNRYDLVRWSLGQLTCLDRALSDRCHRQQRAQGRTREGLSPIVLCENVQRAENRYVLNLFVKDIPVYAPIVICQSILCV